MQREVRYQADEDTEPTFIRTLTTFTIPEAAEALGRSLANFRRWVNGELIPLPVLKDTSRGYYCYTREELLIIGRILTEHEREFSYFCAKHEAVSHRIHQTVMGYREQLFDIEQ